ncbi:hypothetical protein HZH68_015940 [Vespula germanica]|uniref:Uncharacterized protein n=1 Tax=Vespula germanica TaxID=30212 RepID=A0A834MQK5_VESGE|nr:hypothetical protein HZH68_015940 [Vespula germanica]
MRATENVLLILGLNVFGMITTYAAPLSNPKTDWEKRENFTPVITSDCSSNVRCLEVLPLEPVAGDTIILPEDIPPTRSRYGICKNRSIKMFDLIDGLRHCRMPRVNVFSSAYIRDNDRIQTRRQITNVGTDSVLQSWKDNAPILESEARPLLPVKRVPSKTIKKDSFLSHGWGAGGMPFSVLYMTPHGSRLNHAASTATGTSHQQEVGKANENPTAPLAQPNYRVAVRNGPSMQSRRQYPIIPQLFISYGWGTLGK